MIHSRKTKNSLSYLSIRENIMNKNITFYLLAFLLASLIYTAQASALMLPMSTGELTLRSDNVVRGRVLLVWSEWDENVEFLFTRAVVMVDQNITGLALNRFLTVEYPGGTFGRIKMVVSDSPQLHFGEDVLLFLNQVQSMSSRTKNQVHRIFGAAQGKYAIDVNGIARKGGFAVIHQRDNLAARAANNPIDNDIPIDDLIDKIETADSGR